MEATLFTGHQLAGDLAGDRGRHLILQLQDVAEVAIVAVGPKMSAVAYFDELHCDTDTIVAAADATVEEVGGAQFARDSVHISRRTFVLHSGAARDYAELGWIDSAEL
jgi:hypothetical protein